MHPALRYREGTLPLLVSVPHDGREVPDDLRARMTDTALALPDTDWHVAQLYDWVRDMGASLVVATQSRYVVDMNRPPDNQALYPGQVSTGICPVETFAGEPIYRSGQQPDDAEVAARIERYWQPYHGRIQAALDDLVAQYGYALLWDAHSIASEVPRLFDGALPVYNLGTNDGASCADQLTGAVVTAMQASGQPAVVNGRFKGGYITRHYGNPEQGVHAIQLELAQRAYMDETSLDYDATKAAQVRATLERMLRAFLETAKDTLA